MTPQSSSPLVGALVALRAHLLDVVDDLTTIEAALAQPISPPRPAICTETIMEAAAAYYDVTTDDLTSISRRAEVIDARHVALYLCRELLGFSYPRIGQRFALDHTTAMSATKRVRANPGLLEVAQVLTKHLRGE